MDAATIEAGLSPEEAMALRDRLLVRFPVTLPAHLVAPRSVEWLAERALQRFDATYPDTAFAVGKLRARLDATKRRREACQAEGRFYIEAHTAPAGWPAWRVMDRYTGAAAYFALDGLKSPKRHEGFRAWRDADACADKLVAYFRSMGLHDGPDVIARIEPRESAAEEPMHLRVVSLAEWASVAPVVPPPLPSRRGRVVSDHIAVAAIVAKLREGCPWQCLPIEIGVSWATARARLLSWQQRGKWPAICLALQRALPDGQTLNWGHQHRKT